MMEKAQVAAAGFSLAAWREGVLALFLALAVPAILYLAFYAPIPAAHDALHNLRHSVWGVPCH